MIRRCVAEALGTFAIVLFGCGSIAVLHGEPTAHVAVNLVFGLVVMAMVFALGPLSAAHFNPAVTIGFSIAGRFPWRAAPGYIASQFVGAIAAVFLIQILIPAQGIAVQFGATVPTIAPALAVTSESVLTFFLMLVIMAVATDLRVHSAIPGLAIGGTVSFCGLFAGPLTGNSMNPARSLAPALFAGGTALGSVWIDFVGPIVGACGAGLVYEWLRMDRASAQGAPSDLA